MASYGFSSILLIPFLGGSLYLSKKFRNSCLRGKKLYEIHNLYKILGCFVKKYIKFYKLHEILHFFSYASGQIFPRPLVPTNLKSDSIKETIDGHICRLFNIEQKLKWTRSILPNTID